MSTPPRTAFVLSGGAALGAIQVGMLKALYERQVEPDLIVGTSVGAINGAFIASRPFTPETAGELAAIWYGIGRGQVFPLNPVTGFLGFFGARRHLVSDRALRELLAEHIGFERLEGAPVAFHVIATDVLSGTERRLSHGNALEAVMASAAIPGVFPPVDWGHRYLIDGGVSNNAPISHAIELGAERVYVLPTGSACDLPEPPHGALGMLLHSMSLLVMQEPGADLEGARAQPALSGRARSEKARPDLRRDQHDAGDGFPRPAMSGPVREARLVEALLGPARAEVGCDACFRELDRYVEIELAGGNAERALPGVRTHLDGCAACRKEYWGLRALLRGWRRFSYFSTG